MEKISGFFGITAIAMSFSSLTLPHNLLVSFLGVLQIVVVLTALNILMFYAVRSKYHCRPYSSYYYSYYFAD